MTRAIVEYYSPGDWYDWPLYLMSHQHSVRSVLDEYRGGAAPHFHDGIDIDAEQGTPVFAVREGTAYQGGFEDGSYVWVVGPAQHWYIHLDERMAHGEYVNIGDSLGVTNELDHVHLGDGPDQAEINPLRAPHESGIEPFDDYLAPTVDEIVFVLNGDYENPQDPFNLPRDRLDIIADARDAISGGGSNAGIWKIGYQISWDPPVFNFQFDSWIPSAHIDWVYAPGSQTTGPFRYIVTNHVGSDGWWDASGMSSGEWYTVYVIAEDVWLGNTDELCVDVRFLSVDEAWELPEDLSGVRLLANYPNPFNPALTVRYAVREASRVWLAMYDVSGRRVITLMDEWQDPGIYFTRWDGKDESGREVASGVYFCRLETDKYNATSRAVLAR